MSLVHTLLRDRPGRRHFPTILDRARLVVGLALAIMLMVWRAVSCFFPHDEVDLKND